MKIYTLDWFVKTYDVDIYSIAYFNITEESNHFQSNYTITNHFYKMMEKYPRAQITDVGQRRETDGMVWVIDLLV